MAGESMAAMAGKELTGKAVMWGPALAGIFLLGPVGALLGLVASVAIMDQLVQDPSAPSDSDTPRRDGRDT
ncbi:hypothetical protein [Fimbriiglobus ruber]|uniref:hypothetical protein n=1 Tax=Fimbriiglobus ruber TaxID=1908690 RepID=UPI00117B7D76|nr:hypothetical protein [Fimbriiglobus ruber]